MAHLEHKEISGERGWEDMTVLALVKDWFLSEFSGSKCLLCVPLRRGHLQSIVYEVLFSVAKIEIQHYCDTLEV